MKRSAPDFYAAELLNEILGGSPVTLRLWEDVREQRGLTYGASSSLVDHQHSNALQARTATRSDRAAGTLACAQGGEADGGRGADRGRPRGEQEISDGRLPAEIFPGGHVMSVGSSGGREKGDFRDTLPSDAEFPGHPPTLFCSCSPAERAVCSDE
ncbi:MULTISPECIES: insulinase family protein [unclassified Mesorhizobium]|uniref:insulinase family protein n=1 Tax=unclassified Mesorhizobium TaxID=325217 RepID=UPI001FDF9BF1|nr:MULTISPECIES: insulinase family protein [unclassified Mesorhizobium]